MIMKIITMVAMLKLLFLPPQHYLKQTAVNAANRAKEEREATVKKHNNTKNNRSDHTHYVMQQTNLNLQTSKRVKPLQLIE